VVGRAPAARRYGARVPTAFSLLARRARDLGDRPAVVFADATTGERVELSFATLHQWAAKTANLLADDLDVGQGSEVRLDVPVHWLVPALALGAWAVGAAVRVEPGGDAVVVGHEADLAAGHRASDAPDLVIGTGPGGRLSGEVATSDLGEHLTVADVLAQPDDFLDDPGDDGARAVGGRTQASLLAEAAGGPGDVVLHAGDRVGEALLVLLARALPAGVTVVLARGHDPEALRRLAEQEHVASG
jgi:uncharacterized protein (TIGR03089 family)